MSSFGVSLLFLRKRPGYLRSPFAWAVSMIWNSFRVLHEEWKPFASLLSFLAGRWHWLKFLCQWPTPLCLGLMFNADILGVATVFRSDISYLESRSSLGGLCNFPRLATFYHLMFPITLAVKLIQQKKLSTSGEHVAIWREWALREGPFPEPCPVHLFHLAVPEL